MAPPPVAVIHLRSMHWQSFSCPAVVMQWVQLWSMVFSVSVGHCTIRSVHYKFNNVVWQYCLDLLGTALQFSWVLGLSRIWFEWDASFIEDSSKFIATYEDQLLGVVQVYPENGTVAFSAGLHDWAFTLSSFAKLYASKFGVDELKMLIFPIPASSAQLWGQSVIPGHFSSVHRCQQWLLMVKTPLPTCAGDTDGDFTIQYASMPCDTAISTQIPYAGSTFCTGTKKHTPVLSEAIPVAMTVLLIPGYFQLKGDKSVGSFSAQDYFVKDFSTDMGQLTQDKNHVNVAKLCMPGEFKLNKWMLAYPKSPTWIPVYQFSGHFLLATSFLVTALPKGTYLQAQSTLLWLFSIPWDPGGDYQAGRKFQSFEWGVHLPACGAYPPGSIPDGSWCSVSCVRLDLSSISSHWTQVQVTKRICPNSKSSQVLVVLQCLVFLIQQQQFGPSVGQLLPIDLIGLYVVLNLDGGDSMKITSLVILCLLYCNNYNMRSIAGLSVVLESEDFAIRKLLQGKFLPIPLDQFSANHQFQLDDHTDFLKVTIHIFKNLTMPIFWLVSQPRVAVINSEEATHGNSEASSCVNIIFILQFYTLSIDDP